MRICMITSAPLPPQEGIGAYVWNLSQFLTRQGHHVQIITRGGQKKTTREEREGVSVWRPTFLPIYPFHVHLHGAFVNTVIRRLVDEVDLYHLHTPLPPPIRTQKAIVLTVHTPMLADVRSIRLQNVHSALVKLQLPVSYLLEKQLLAQADCVTAVANSVAHELQSYNIDPREAVVVGNGVDIDVFFPNSSELPGSGITVLAAGRLGLRKGFEDLITCASIVQQHIPSIRFLIAGTGPLGGSLRRQIARAGLEECITLLGHVSARGEMAKLYRNSTLFVHPAHYEGLPTVLLEAMACGCPVIATSVSGILDVISPGVNGMLVPPHAPEAMANAILTLLNNEPQMRSLGVAARRTIEREYSLELIGSRFIECYEKALLVAERCFD